MSRAYRPETKYQVTSLIAVVLLLLIVFVSVGYFFFLARPDQFAAQNELSRAFADATALWQERRPAAYRYVVDRQCNCPPEVDRAYVVTVDRDGRRAAFSIPVESSAGLLLDRPENPVWLETVVDDIARALESGDEITTEESTEIAQKWMDEPFARSCQELYRQGQTTDGNYTIDVDGYNGPRAPMTATCDFITSGNGQGGWTLVMNYVRDSTNSTNTRSALYHRLPLMVSNTLGDNESGHATAWGHAAPALFADINFDAIRVNCKDGSHSRVVDFSTTSSQMISLFTTGKGQITAFADFTQLADHTANMGSSSVSGLGTTDAVDEVMGHWMQGGSGNEFTAGGLSGGTLTWECDNNSQTHTNDTIHRFWVK